MRLVPAVLAFLIAAFPALAAEKMTPPEAASAIEAGKMVLVDIRTPGEWAQTGVPTPATPIDMTSKGFVEDLKKVLAANPGKAIGFICRTGNRSSYLVNALEKAGLTNIVDVTGGIAGNGTVTGWIAEGLPMKRN